MGLQKYKIYINGKPVFLAERAQASEIGILADKNNFVGQYVGKKKMIRQYLDLLDKNKSVESVALYAENLEELWADFQSCYKIQEAAGGYVLNSEGQLLVFYRRGSWDMPKGKIDPGETPEEAAVREVQEETGLVHVALGAFLMHTYHTFVYKEQRILKKTWWYSMKTTDTQVVPQTEEDIEEIRWVEPRAWVEAEKEVYGNIQEVILAGLEDQAGG